MKKSADISLESHENEREEKTHFPCGSHSDFSINIRPLSGSPGAHEGELFSEALKLSS